MACGYCKKLYCEPDSQLPHLWPCFADSMQSVNLYVRYFWLFLYPYMGYVLGH